MNTQNYACLKKNSYVHENYELVPIRIEDAELIRKWRNEQIKFLRQEKFISNEEQSQYFEKVILPTFDQLEPNIILFSFLENSILIGYGGLVNINWNKKISEISFLVETNRSKKSFTYETDFSIFLNLLKKITCNELKFNKLFTETYDIRPNHINILEKNEFKISKKGNDQKIINGNSVEILFHSYICKMNENI